MINENIIKFIAYSLQYLLKKSLQPLPYINKEGHLSIIHTMLKSSVLYKFQACKGMLMEILVEKNNNPSIVFKIHTFLFRIKV